MFEKLTGTLDEILPDKIVIDVNGVGYGVQLPLSDLCQLSKLGKPIKLWITTWVREDDIRLYGFPKFQQKIAFETLIKISGIGPKVALAILSSLTVETLQRAVFLEQKDVIQAVPGVGARTAERLIVELKSKLKKFQEASISGPGAAQFASTNDAQSEDVSESAALFDALSALENLGYKSAQVRPILQKIVGTEEGRTLDFQGLLKNALIELSSSKSSKPTSKAKQDARKEMDLF